MSHNNPLSDNQDDATTDAPHGEPSFAHHESKTDDMTQSSASDPAMPITESGHPQDVLEKKLADQTAKAAELWDKLLRATADFDNFKKRVAKDRAEAAKYASSTLLRNLLTVMDNFEMALSAANNAQEQSVLSLKTGVAMIYQQLKQVMQEAGLSEIDAVGQVFDPNYHEAVSQIESETIPEGHVAEQLRKGYRLHDRLLRAASVVVSKGPPSSALQPGDSPNLPPDR